MRKEVYTLINVFYVIIDRVAMHAFNILTTNEEKSEERVWSEHVLSVRQCNFKYALESK